MNTQLAPPPEVQILADHRPRKLLGTWTTSGTSRSAPAAAAS